MKLCCGVAQQLVAWINCMFGWFSTTIQPLAMLFVLWHKICTRNKNKWITAGGKKTQKIGFCPAKGNSDLCFPLHYESMEGG